MAFICIAMHQSAFAWGQKKPETFVSAPINLATPGASRAQVIALAEGSACAKYAWKGRGRAPVGFVIGHALAYANAVCTPGDLADSVISGPVGSPDRDALAWLAVKTKDTRLATWTLAMGLAQRESSGRMCAGADVTNPSSIKHDTAEAGLYQTSWDARAAHKVLSPMLSSWKGSCLAKEFAEGTKCSALMASGVGTGDGVNFQKRAKLCPAFATDFALVTLRLLRKHYGPLNRKEAEYRAECETMLSGVAVIAKKNCAAFP